MKPEANWLYVEPKYITFSSYAGAMRHALRTGQPTAFMEDGHNWLITGNSDW